jgi:hypothetical protein
LWILSQEQCSSDMLMLRRIQRHEPHAPRALLTSCRLFAYLTFPRVHGFIAPRVSAILAASLCARQQPFTIVHEFVDVATAKQSGRGGFSAMLAFLKTNKDDSGRKDRPTLSQHQGLDHRRRLGPAVHFVKENAVISKASRSSEKFMHGMHVLRRSPISSAALARRGGRSGSAGPGPTAGSTVSFPAQVPDRPRSA